MGFWPLVKTPAAFSTPRTRGTTYTTNEERELGYTPGAGASKDPAHRGFAFDRSVPGRVEEPDRAHQNDIKIRKEYELTYGQVDAMLKYVNESRNKDYNLYRYNCTTFAVEAVKAAGQTAPSGAVLGVCFPNALYKELYQKRQQDERIIVEKLDPSCDPDSGGKRDIKHGDKTIKELYQTPKQDKRSYFTALKSLYVPDSGREQDIRQDDATTKE